MRVCPIWNRTADELRLLATARTASEFVFLNRRNERLTRFGIYSLVRRAVTKASSKWPALASKRISPSSTFMCGPFAPVRRRHQYYPGLARARLPGHHPYLRGGRPRDERESTRALRPAELCANKSVAFRSEAHGVSTDALTEPNAKVMLPPRACATHFNGVAQSCTT
jgi:hypothetical protein